MSQVEILDLTKISHTFPVLPMDLIKRDNLVDTLETMFEGEVDVIIVEGLEGIGKTTLLAEFCQRHPYNAFPLFIRPSSKWNYDPGLIK